MIFIVLHTAWKVSKYGVFSGPYFPAFGLSVFSPNAGKYRPEKIPYLYTFHVVTPDLPSLSDEMLNT